MPKKSLKCKKNMFVINLDFEKFCEKYNIEFEKKNNKNTTKITELDLEDKIPKLISFIDDTKKSRKCHISFIDFNSDKKYKCFWDKNYIPKDFIPLGCPIRYVSNKLVKTYYSELSKDNYTINEFITDRKNEEIKEEIKSGEKDIKKFSINEAGYYETDGIFCSFNCCMAFLNDPDNKRKDIYRYSESLLMKMYQDIMGEKTVEIIPSPHWRLLEDFGGNMKIEEFRNNFNKTEYIDHGMLSIARLYEDKIRL